MTQIFRAILAILLTITLGACGHNEEFVVHGKLKNCPADKVIITYQGRNGLVQSEASISQDGQFTVGGNAPKSTLATVTLSDGTWLATLIVRDGDEINIEGDADQPLFISVSGNDDSHRLAEWHQKYAKEIMRADASSVNNAIKKEVLDNPDETWVAALFSTRFITPGYESLADSLLGLLKTEARPNEILQGFNAVVTAAMIPNNDLKLQSLSLYVRCDSVVTFRPGSQRTALLCILGDDKSARDSIAPQLRKLYGEYKRPRQLTMVEISVAGDSTSWRRSIGADTTRWEQSWAVGGTANPSLRKLHIPTLPYFIVVDSTGTQLYRGGSIKQASSRVDKNNNIN